MQSKQPLYLSAFNAEHEIVDIKGSIQGESYICIGCGEPMKANRGCKKKWHFAHIKDTQSCSYDNYLHTIAEIKLKEWFEKNDSITISIRRECICKNKSTCKMGNYNEHFCKWEEKSSFNLKDFYDTCEKEKTYKGFRADLFLSNKEKKNTPPIFLEICNNHKIEKEKKDSGIKIIEIDIKSEDDLTEILKSTELKESEKFRFYNFKKQTDNSQLPPQNCKPYLYKIVLHSSWKIYKQKNIDCLTYSQHNENAIAEITINQNHCGNVYQFGAIKMAELYKEFRACNICRYHKQNADDFVESNNFLICCLYKQIGRNRECKPADALQCSAFRMLTPKELNEIKGQFKDVHIETWQNPKYIISK